MYTCDNWVVIHIKGDDPHYRVLVGTSGGYLDGDSWRINSGITSVVETEQTFEFSGASGSTYSCGKGSYRLRVNNAHIWEKLKEQHGDLVEIMPEETDWINQDWIIK